MLFFAAGVQFEAFNKIVKIYFQKLRKLAQCAYCNPVCSVFVFLNLLKGSMEFCRNLLLR